MKYRSALHFIACLFALAASAILSPAATAGAASRMVDTLLLPDGRLSPPTNYREWVFLSSGLNMVYLQEATPDHSMFDNVFVDPAAYRSFTQTGTWPEGTLLVKEDRGATGKGAINQHGKFQTAEVMAVEVHVKDSTRFAGGWAFFFFKSLRTGPARRIPTTASCYSCHQQHGAVDTTFVQFYPTLLGIPVDKHRLSPSYRP